MSKTAIIVLADTETKESLGRAVNAMKAVEDYASKHADVKFYFDGAGSKWPAALLESDHDYHDLFEKVRSRITGVCEYCAGAFEVKDTLQNAGIPLSSEHDGHFSYHDLTTNGYQVITF